MATSHRILVCLMLCFSHLSVFCSITQPLFLPLTNSFSTTQFTSTHHLLKSTSTRSAARFRHHHRHRHRHLSHQVSLPLAPGSDYTLSFTLNSHPPQAISLYLDTGSDLVWFPCKPFECILCEGKTDNTTATSSPPKLSSAAVHCESSACSAAHSNLPTSDLCAIANCPLDSIETSDCKSFSCPPLYYAYGDGSLIAHLYRDSITLPLATPSLVLHNFTFGCAHTALAEPVGVAGFGRGVLSLPAQLATSSLQLGNQFSYCLVYHSFDSDRVRPPSPLILGRYDDKQKRENGSAKLQPAEFVYTSMLDNPYFYCVGLEGISVGKKNIPAPAFLKRVDREGSGGLVVDSGTTFTMLPASLYDLVVAEFDNRVGRVNDRARDIEDKTGLAPCYYYDKLVNVPSLVFHFAGNGSSVVLPRRNYFYEFLDVGDGIGAKERKVGCFMLMNGGDDADSGGPGAILGNYQQQGFEVVYDLENGRVGFARRQCASLWESLNQG